MYRGVYLVYGPISEGAILRAAKMGVRYVERVCLMKFLRKTPEDGTGVRVPPDEANGEVKARLPAIYEHLTEASWEDGSERLTSTLLLFCDAGVFKACLNDREGQRSMWVSSNSILRVLEALEEALQTGSGEWRDQGKGRSWKR